MINESDKIHLEKDRRKEAFSISGILFFFLYPVFFSEQRYAALGVFLLI